MLNPQAALATAGMPDAALVEAIVRLAREASIEINVQDVADLEPSRALLAPGTKVYVSHLPRQTWLATETACRAVRAAGFLPVPASAGAPGGECVGTRQRAGRARRRRAGG